MVVIFVSPCSPCSCMRHRRAQDAHRKYRLPCVRAVVVSQMSRGAHFLGEGPATALSWKDHDIVEVSDALFRRGDGRLRVRSPLPRDWPGAAEDHTDRGQLRRGRAGAPDLRPIGPMPGGQRGQGHRGHGQMLGPRLQDDAPHVADHPLRRLHVDLRPSSAVSNWPWVSPPTPSTPIPRGRSWRNADGQMPPRPAAFCGCCAPCPSGRRSARNSDASVGSWARPRPSSYDGLRPQVSAPRQEHDEADETLVLDTWPPAPAAPPPRRKRKRRSRTRTLRPRTTSRPWRTGRSPCRQGRREGGSSCASFAGALW